MVTMFNLNAQVVALLATYQFKLVEAEERTDANGLVKAVEVRFTLPNGKLIQVEAFIKEVDELTGFFGSVTDPTDDNSTEFDYIDSMGSGFDGCLMSVIRQLSDHYA